MKKNYLKLCASVFALAIVATNFTGCFSCSSPKSKKHIAAIIRPTTEELESERSKMEKLLMKELQEKARNNEEFEKLKRQFGFLTVMDVQKFYNEIEAVLSSRKDLRLVDRNRINDVLKEHEFSLSSFSDSNKFVEIGKALNCDTLIYFELDAPFQIHYSGPTLQTVCIEFFDVNTFTKKLVIVNKFEDASPIWNPFRFWEWPMSKRALRKVDLD